jgi:PDZ and LIM domain protein 5/6/7
LRNQPISGVGSNIPNCATCHQLVRGPFVSAMGKVWCPNHFVCASCSVNLEDVGFVEENGQLYCEQDYAAYFAPHCYKCQQTIMGVKMKF